jgi:menaquinone-dependent protoporphyrinogen IX oxidase
MRVLVTWGSKLGGTEEIARTVGAELEASGYDVVAQPAARAPILRVMTRPSSAAPSMPIDGTGTPTAS